jgi:hypothetical protein
MSTLPLILTSLSLGCAPTPADTGATWGPRTVETDAGVYTLDLELTPDPPVAGGTALWLAARDAGGESVSPTLTLTPWMPVHGHGVSEEPVYTEVDGGVEAAFSWSMPGDWELRIEVSDGQQVDTVVVPVEVL